MRAESRWSLLSEINVTPLVDVMLVLLIVFMVAAPLLQQGIAVKLPKAVTTQPLSGSGVVISLTKDHLLYLNDDLVTLKELRHKLGALTHQEPVLIQADQRAYVNRLIELWDLCRDVGVQEIHLATKPE